MRSRVVVATIALLTLPGALAAQICLGTPSLTTAAANLGASAGFFDGGKRYGAGAVVGSRFFGAGEFSFIDFDDTTLSLKAVGASIGYEFPTQSQASFCLGATGSYGFGLEIAGIDVTTLTIGPVLAVGLETEISPTVTVIPSAQLGWFFERLNADAGPLGEESETTDYGSLGFGISFVFNEVFTVGPTIAVPIGVDNGDTTFGIGVAVTVGHRE